MTPQEALARIAALCDDAESGDYPTLPARPFVKTVRKVLADVTPEPGCTLSPEEHLPVLRAISDYLTANPPELDALPFRDRLVDVAARIEANR